MKKVRDIPTEWRDLTWAQKEEYQEHLRAMVAEEGQLGLAKAFMDGKPDDGLPLVALDHEVLFVCNKPLTDKFGEQHSIWEEGEDVCYSYGRLILRGLVRCQLIPSKTGTWLAPGITEEGRKVLGDFTHSETETP